MNKKPSIFNRLHVMNGWPHMRHCWWRYVLLPFGWERVEYEGRGWVCVSLFGFAFFWTW
jgi:hypothetical protein